MLASPRGIGKPLCIVCLTAVLLLVLAGCSRDPVVRAESSYKRAEKYLRENKPDAAVIELRRALQLNPQLAKAHFALGAVELQRGSMLTAFQEFYAASLADPDNLQAQIMVAELLARARNYTQSRRQAELILSRWPDNKTGTLLLAESEIGLQNYKRGQALVNEVLAADPNNVRALQDLALLQLAQNDLPQAQATLRRAWQLDPKSPAAVAVLSSTYEGQRDLQTAESVLKEALESKSQSDSHSNPCWQASTCATKGMQRPNHFTGRFRPRLRTNLNITTFWRSFIWVLPPQGCRDGIQASGAG